MTRPVEIPPYQLMDRAQELLKESEVEYARESPPPRGGILRILPYVTRAGVLAQQAHAYAALAEARMTGGGRRS